MLPRRLLTIALLGAALALAAFASARAVAAGSGAQAVLAQCPQAAGLTGKFTVAQLQQALRIMPAVTKEYTSCPDVINRALLAAVGHGGKSGGGGGGGSFLPTPVIILLVVLVLLAVTFGAVAVRGRRDPDAPPPSA
ncbi:MAG: hypothetical protein ACR2GZ_12780 [Solirubrobacteraceae bacterium]